MYCFRYGDRGIPAETTPGLRNLIRLFSLLCSDLDIRQTRLTDLPISGSFMLGALGGKILLPSVIFVPS